MIVELHNRSLVKKPDWLFSERVTANKFNGKQAQTKICLLINCILLVNLRNILKIH